MMRNIEEIYSLWGLLSHVRHLGLQLRQKELEPYDLTPRQAAILHVIPRIQDNATPAEISRWIGRKSHTVSSNLSTLERKGLIERNKNLEKKNLIQVSLTEKGILASKKASEVNAYREIMSVLSDEEVQQLRSICEKLQDTLIENLENQDRLMYQRSKI